MTKDDDDLLSDRKTQDLIQAALALPNRSDERWKVIQELRIRGTREVFDAAVELFDKGDTADALACDILAQLGCKNMDLSDGYRFPYRAETLPLLSSAELESGGSGGCRHGLGTPRC